MGKRNLQQGPLPHDYAKDGLALSTYAKERGKKSVVIGNDIRTTSTLLSKAFISGLLSSGMDVANAGTTFFGACVSQAGHTRRI